MPGGAVVATRRGMLLIGAVKVALFSGEVMATVGSELAAVTVTLAPGDLVVAVKLRVPIRLPFSAIV